MSLRNMSLRDGYGPIVSDGVTAQAAFVVVGVVAVAVVSTEDGLVGESPQAVATAAAAAPMAPSAARRLSCVAVKPRKSFTIVLPDSPHCDRRMLGMYGSGMKGLRRGDCPASRPAALSEGEVAGCPVRRMPALLPSRAPHEMRLP